MTTSLLADIYTNVIVVILRTIQESISTLVCLCIQDIVYYVQLGIANIQPILSKIEPIMVETVILGNRQWVVFSRQCEKYLAKHPKLQYVVKGWSFVWRGCVCAVMTTHDALFVWYSEPMDEPWTQISYLTYGITSKAYNVYTRQLDYPTFQPMPRDNILDVYLEGGDCFQILMCIFMNREYYETHNTNEQAQFVLTPETMYDIVSSQVGDTIQQSKMNTDVLVYTKVNGLYISRVVCDNRTLTVEDCSFSPARSNVRFLAVYYAHPEMKKPIAIRIPETLFYVGNHVLSATHILHILRQMPIYVRFLFDARYVLTILDHNVQRIVLHYNEYLVLGENDYTIAKI